MGWQGEEEAPPPPTNPTIQGNTAEAAPAATNVTVVGVSGAAANDSDAAAGEGSGGVGGCCAPCLKPYTALEEWRPKGSWESEQAETEHKVSARRDGLLGRGMGWEVRGGRPSTFNPHSCCARLGWKETFPVRCGHEAVDVERVRDRVLLENHDDCLVSSFVRFELRSMVSSWRVLRA